MPAHDPAKKVTLLLILLLVLLWMGITAYKFWLLDYRFDTIIPRAAYTIVMATQGKGYGGDIHVAHYLPDNEPGQVIRQELVHGDYDRYAISLDGRNRLVDFEYDQRYGGFSSQVSFEVRSSRVVYKLPEYFSSPPSYPGGVARWIEATELIQKNDSLISRLIRVLEIETQGDQIATVRRIFDYCHTKIKPAGFSAETDAVLTAKLGEASCNGKSRLFVALCRNAGIPARMVGGLILQGRRKTTTHAWVEAWIAGNWVPFCPLNGYFAEKPASYMVLYRGDHALITRTRNIVFSYHFLLSRQMVPQMQTFERSRKFDIITVWNTFEKAGVPLRVLSVVLVIPLGALVTIIFRNVIGITTFGTFLPALISYAFLGTGILWGTGIFCGIIGTGALLNAALTRLRLLHTPRLTVIMVFTVAALITLGMLGVKTGNAHVANAFLFPLAILSITVERFLVVTRERGVLSALGVLAGTMGVVAFCYLVMRSQFLQMAFVVLPESYLLVIAAALYLGHWTGMRMSELVRFRSLLFTPGVKDGPHA